MPEVSRFHGIRICMYYREQDYKRPHFHALYAGMEMSVDILTLEVIAGSLPLSKRRLVIRWARQHGPELVDAWRSARAEQPLPRIAPLA